MSIPKEVDEFRETFYTVVQQIPKGKISTYGALARALGDIRASRAVGRMLNQNPRPIEVPCHRVIMSDGSIGGFGSGVEKKKSLLRSEGIYIQDEKITDFKDKLFVDFKSEKILNKLRKKQLDASEKVIIKDDFDDLEIIGGVDVSYGEKKGYASLSLWKEDEEIDNIIIKKEVSFPYIPTYLAFRELPLLLDVLNRSEYTPDVILVDGNGILHPHKIGIASHLGVETNIPTIGVAKSMLIGNQITKISHDEPVSEIIFEEEKLGFAYLSSDRAKNPIFISPGHRISLDTSFNIVRNYCDYKVPEPIRRAHIEATRRRKKNE